MRRLGLLTVLLCLLLAPAASAQQVIQRAASALRTDPVYVDPDAPAKVSAADADRIAREIQARDAGPMYVAVLPASAADEAGGSADQVAGAIRSILRRHGTYAVVVGNHFRAGSDVLERGVAGEQAAVALDEHGEDGVPQTLLAFVDRVGDVKAGREPEGGGGASSPGGAGRGGAGIGAGAILIPLALLGGGAFLLLSRHRRRREEDAQVAELKENVRDDLVALGDDIRALDLDVEMPDTDPQAKAEYAKAVEAYERADSMWETARRPEDFEPIGAALEEGRYAMTAAKARLAGQPVPERTPPCFFDPRHGPSSREVEWAPEGGAPRVVPACEADAQRVERGEDPQAREVLVGGQRMPYWQAGPMYAPFAGGFFGGFGGGLLPGLMMGTLLGSAFGGGWGVPVAYGAGDDYGSGGDFGGGDFGGGDFGGGDFGGG